ncbi:hypothetical protein Patl1_36254 [Pistacia atlantica]|nr:hypothetical protein Patl1_36254 [Pistacia atlantica]
MGVSLLVAIWMMRKLEKGSFEKHAPGFSAKASDSIGAPGFSAEASDSLTLTREELVPSYVLRDFRIKLAEHITFHDELEREWSGKVMRWKDG